LANQGKGASQRRSPLYTSKRRELEKREFLAKAGRDIDGAYRVKGRFDEPETRSNG
jgi:hypothetical protein